MRWIAFFLCLVALPLAAIAFEPHPTFAISVGAKDISDYPPGERTGAMYEAQHEREAWRAANGRMTASERFEYEKTQREERAQVCEYVRGTEFEAALCGDR